LAPVELGLVTIDQLVPFQCSTSVLSADVVEELPTAKQLVVLAHATPYRMTAFVPVGLGLVTIDQLVPFQCSTNVLVPEPLDEKPTAKQLVVLGHETPYKTTKFAPVGWGLATIDQLVPFQRCSKVDAAGPLLTAKQLVVLAHDTP
jgi:hypothetical protein